MLILGMVLGRWLFSPINPILSDAKMSEIDFVQFDPHTNKVVLTINTVDENTIYGNLDKPEIQRLIAQTLVSDPRPNVRLKTVGALSMVKTFNKYLLDALVEVVENDENSGIRLKAIKLMNTLPLSPYVKQLLIRVFTRVLLNENNTAICNEAVNGLSRISNSDFAPFVFDIAKSDTNEYLKYKANLMLNRTKLERSN